MKYGKYIKRHPASFIIAPLFLLAESCGEFFLPFLNAKLINYINGAITAKATVLGGVPEGVNMETVLSYIVAMVALAIAMLFFGLIGARKAIYASTKLSSEIREDVFNHYTDLPYNVTSAFPEGLVHAVLTKDIQQIQAYIERLLRSLFRTPVMMVGATVMLFTLSPDYAPLVLCFTFILGYIIFRILRRTAPIIDSINILHDGLNNSVSESIQGNRVIKSFGREKYFYDRFTSACVSIYEDSVRYNRVNVMAQPLIIIITNFASLAFVWLVGRQIRFGKMEIGTLTAMITYAGQLTNSVNELSQLYQKLKRAKSSEQRIDKIMKAESKDLPNATKSQTDFIQKGVIRFDKVFFRYKGIRRSNNLEDLSFTIPAGKFIAVVGPTGCGKTTVGRLLLRLYSPQSGDIYLDETNIKEVSPLEIHSKIGYVPQQNNLLSGSIRYNLTLGNPSATDEEIETACQIACADEFLVRLPKGLETDLGHDGGKVSGGQRQRLCLARTLLTHPQILCMDDSLNALDNVTASRIIKRVVAIPNMTKIVICQRISLIKDADLIFAMDNGKIVGTGTHKELMESNSFYQSLCASQQEEQ